MQHTEASTQIYFTTDYARFNMISGNRQLNDLKIRKIIKEITSGNDMLRYYPIQVNQNNDRLDILDGQHRFYIARKLGKPIFYILVKEVKKMIDIAKINSNVEKWNPKDFLNCYIQEGNKNYLQVQDFLDKYKISLSVSLKMLHDGNPGGDNGGGPINEWFRNGLFKVNYLKETESLCDKCNQFSKFKSRLSRTFIISIYKIIEAKLIKVDDLISAYNKRSEMLTEQANFKAYIINLEQIYNIGKHTRVIIA